MEDHAILEELLALLELNNVTIRKAHMAGRGGGLCKTKDKQIFFIDEDALTADSAAICAQAVRQIVDIEQIYLKPQVRDFLEKNT